MTNDEKSAAFDLEGAVEEMLGEVPVDVEVDIVVRAIRDRLADALAEDPRFKGTSPMPDCTGRVARRTATGIEVTPDGAAWPPPPFVERIDGSAPTTFRDAMAPALVEIDPDAPMVMSIPLDERIESVTIPPSDHAWTVSRSADGGLTLRRGRRGSTGAITRAERAEAQLAALRSAAGRWNAVTCDVRAGVYASIGSGPEARIVAAEAEAACDALIDAERDTAAAAEAHDRRVRAEALEAAAEECALSLPVGPPSAIREAVCAWLCKRAEIERSR